jgi:Fe-S-cluster containining protein
MKTSNSAHLLVRYKAITTEHPWMTESAIRKMTDAIIYANDGLTVKLMKLNDLADEISAALAKHTPCHEGCSSCCKMVTMVYEHEAERLANASGWKMRRLPYSLPDVALQKAQRHVGKKCPFLIDNRCSVYADRPIICRLHNSLHKDESLCDVNAPLLQRIARPFFDPDYVEMPYHRLNLAHRPKEPWGAIHDFFPDY